ncbi:MAG: secretin N-terminal domain-containing protein, partial [Candidatus Omnitrophica bacterium]|nr:secretin N-terminal domain-containing protein [Candidatus Omnitrophota bacterium]
MKNKILLSLAVFFIFSSVSLFAQSQSPKPKEAPQNKITLDIKGMDITDVLKMLATRAGVNIVIGKNVTGRVTMFLKDVDVQDAFEIILLSNELAYEKKGDILNVMTQRDYELQYGERFLDKKEARVIRLQYAKAADLSKSLTQIKSNIGRVIADEGSNTLTLIDVPEKLKEMEEFIRNTDLPVQTKVFSLNYSQADKLSAKIQESITKSVGSMKIDERTNKIAITDYPQKLDEIGKIIAAFDEKTPQVLIDAQIIEISPEKNQFAMGVDWDYWLKNHVRLIGSMPAPSLTDIASIPNKLSLGVAASNEQVNSTGQYSSVIDMLQVIGKTKILSSPRIMALNNQEARILVGTKEAYITSAVSQTGQSSVTSQTVNFVDVGIKLYVTPTINRDGFVTMKIRPEISSSKRTDITSEGQITQIPIVTTSESETTIMVKDGTTIIIAGLKKDSQDKEVSKIPWLGDIPLLGYLARNTKIEYIKTELVIFITPHIITGEEPTVYTSLTNDQDINYIPSFA